MNQAIYSPNESAINSGFGFWNMDAQTWDIEEKATIFDNSDEALLNTVKIHAVGHDARFVDVNGLVS